MPKIEYLDQKVRMDEEANSIEEDLVSLPQELAKIPKPAELEVLKQFAVQISQGVFSVENFSLSSIGIISNKDLTRAFKFAINKIYY